MQLGFKHLYNSDKAADITNLSPTEFLKKYINYEALSSACNIWE